MSAVGANNASDIGLIVQGTLIFLSACIAVLGYAVQSRLSAKAHERQLRLEREERHKDEVSRVCCVLRVAPFEAKFFRMLGSSQILPQSPNPTAHSTATVTFI